jgi:hypothetical protein
VLVGRRHGETKERCVVEEPGSRIVWLVEEDPTGFGRMVSNSRAGFALTDRRAILTALKESLETQRDAIDRAILDRIDELVRPGVNINPADTSYGEQVLKPPLRRR